MEIIILTLSDFMGHNAKFKMTTMNHGGHFKFCIVNDADDDVSQAQAPRKAYFDLLRGIDQCVV